MNNLGQVLAEGRVRLRLEMDVKTAEALFNLIYDHHLEWKDALDIHGESEMCSVQDLLDHVVRNTKFGFGGAKT